MLVCPVPSAHSQSVPGRPGLVPRLVLLVLSSLPASQAASISLPCRCRSDLSAQTRALRRFQLSGRALFFAFTTAATCVQLTSVLLL